jgi:hypothetical protein
MTEKSPLKILLSVVDPSGKNTIPPEEWINDKKVFQPAMELAVKNGLHYKFISTLLEKGHALPWYNPEKWSEDQENITKISSTIALLEKVLPENHIDYIIIKIFNTVPHSPNDIDLFVKNNDREKVLSILEANGMKPLHSSIAETKMIGSYAKTDIYTEISYLGIEFLDKDFLLGSGTENSFFGKKYPALNNESDLLMLVPHYLFGHGRITLLDFLHLKNRIAHSDIEFCRSYAKQKGWLYIFDATMDLIKTLDKKIESDDIDVQFPYRFNRIFITKCIAELPQLHMNRTEKLFLHGSFLLEDIVYSLENTFLYKIVKSISPLRNLINSVSAFFKTMRGDRKSSD